MAKASEPDPASESAVRRHGVAGQARQIAALLLGGGPAQQRVIADGVLHVDDHARRGIHRGQLLHRQNGLEETAALAAVFLGDLDAHQAHFEKLADEVFAEDAGFIHFADVRADLFAREFAHGGLEELFVFGERGERTRRGVGHGRRKHTSTVTPSVGKALPAGGVTRLPLQFRLRRAARREWGAPQAASDVGAGGDCGRDARYNETLSTSPAWTIRCPLPSIRL